MLRKPIFLLATIFLAASTGLAQSRITMYIGDVELRLGMSQELTMKLLAAKYNVTAAGGATDFSVSEHKNYLGMIAFESNELTYISRSLDTSGWPNDEGFAVARVIYDAVSGSIAQTGSDGAKRGNARIVIGSGDTGGPVRGNLKTIEIYINERRISISIWDGANGGRSVSASVAIRKKPW